MFKILVADSSAYNAGLISQCLDFSEYEIITAESGGNALAQAELFKPDIVILDTDLPDISGFDVCKKIKGNPRTEFSLVLMLISDETRFSGMKAVRAGADDYIEKAFDNAELILKIRSLLRIRGLMNQLHQKYDELEERNAVLDFQLKMSRQIQRSLMPAMSLEFNGLGFTTRYLPAMDIGGDFYDVIRLNDDLCSVVIGDVSGHGISAALLTSAMLMMSRNLATNYYHPEQFLFHLNKEFNKTFQSNSGIYACVFYAVIDTAKRVVRYSNAGQSFPVFVRNKENTAFELEACGVPIGMLAKTEYECHEVSYGRGDTLFFHTDGFSDVYYKDNPKGFSEKLREFLLDVRAEENGDEVLDSALSLFYNNEVAEARRYQQDDVSIILCRMGAVGQKPEQEARGQRPEKARHT